MGEEGKLWSVLIGFIGRSSHDAQTRFHGRDDYMDAARCIQDIAGVNRFYGFSINCHRLERGME